MRGTMPHIMEETTEAPRGRGQESAEVARQKPKISETPPIKRGKPKKMRASGMLELLYHVLSPHGIEHIVHHKYVPGEYTLLDNMLNPWWLCLTDFLPSWLAPNLVTLIGLSPLLVLVGIHWYYSPHLSEQVPAWLHFANAAAILFYNTMDCMDGKQARRTGSSNPLGQLFDHGCDCVSLIFMHSALMALTTPGPTILGMSCLAMGMCSFLMAQWEESYTGVARHASGSIGITELQYSGALGATCGGLGSMSGQGQTTLSWILGTTLQEIIGNNPLGCCDMMVNLSVREMILGGPCVLFLFSMCVQNARITLSVAGERAPGAIAKLCPVLILALLSLSWHPAARIELPRMMILIYAMHSTFLCVQIIVFSMAKQEFQAVQLTVLPFALLVGLSYLMTLHNLWFLMVVHSFAFGIYLFGWVVMTINQIAARLKVGVFRIQKRSS